MQNGFVHPANGTCDHQRKRLKSSELISKSRLARCARTSRVRQPFRRCRITGGIADPYIRDLGEAQAWGAEHFYS